MPFPRWFMRQTATVTPRVTSQRDEGDYSNSDGITFTVRCNLQVNSSEDARLYNRETNTVTGTVYMLPKDTDGNAVAINQVAKLTIDGVDWIVNGMPIDLCSNGAVYQLSVELQK